MAYILWLSRQTGQSYRLPSDAEWEYAARAGTTTTRYWGINPHQACDYSNIADEEWKSENWIESNIRGYHKCDDGFATTAPVGSFKPNDFKLYDVLGNVTELTCLKYLNGSEQLCLKNSDSSTPTFRGSAWDSDPSSNRVDIRYIAKSRDVANLGIGFRLARTLPP